MVENKKMKTEICQICGDTWEECDDVITFNPYCKWCQRANFLYLQIFHIVGQDGPIETNYELIINPKVFEKFKQVNLFSKKPGVNNKTHIYKEKEKFLIKLQQTFFTHNEINNNVPKISQQNIIHNIKVKLNDKIFWWYMKKIGDKK